MCVRACVCLRLLYFLGCSFVILVRAWVRVCVAGRVSGGLREHNSNVGAEGERERERQGQKARGAARQDACRLSPLAAAFF